ncbi:MAG: methyl-accepting chemotaxis protein [Verrucomicrobiota bacterium]
MSYSAAHSQNRHLNPMDRYRERASMRLSVGLGAHVVLAIGLAAATGASLGKAVAVGLIFAGLGIGSHFVWRGNRATRILTGLSAAAFTGLFAYLSGGSVLAYGHLFAAMLGLIFLADGAALLAAGVTAAAFCVAGYAISPATTLAGAGLVGISTLVGMIAAATGLSWVLAERFRLYCRVYLNSTSKLKQMAGRVAGASGEISRSGCNLSDGAMEQATLANQISESIEHLTSTVDATKDNLRKTNELTQRSDANAKEGHGRMSEMLSAVDEIEGNADKISNIIKTIDEISFQTNILALNAAVEAARAGEAGAGFAVVADEVRGLAQRSAKAAGETETLIRVTVESSKRGAQLCKEVSDSIELMREDISQVNTLVSDISTSGTTQFDGIRQVSGDVKRITEITQNNAAVAEESAAAAQQLDALASDLNAMVDQIDERQVEQAFTHSVSQENFSAGTNRIQKRSHTNVPAAATAKDDAFADMTDSSWGN